MKKFYTNDALIYPINLNLFKGSLSNNFTPYDFVFPFLAFQSANIKLGKEYILSYK